MVNDFIVVLNENLSSEVPLFRNQNSGWDEALEDPKVESGWEKIQRSLGLPTSLYPKPSKGTPVNLINVSKVQKYETDDEIRFIIDLVIQKTDVEDMMMIRASFIQDKKVLHDENNFFINTTVNMKVIIEELFITGYLSKETLINNDNFNDLIEEKYQDYDNMEYNDLTDPLHIQKVLLDKYKKRSDEMQGRNNLLDEEGQDFHRTLPYSYEYQNIQNTRTIFDDMNRKNKGWDSYNR